MLYTHLTGEGHDVDDFNAVYVANNDTIFVDGEGLLNEAPHRIGMFVVTGSKHTVPLAGRGLVLGSKGEHTVAVRSTLEEIKAMVSFPSLAEIRVAASMGAYD